MICRTCGADMPEGIEFCKECGSWQEIPTEPKKDLSAFPEFHLDDEPEAPAEEAPVEETPVEEAPVETLAEEEAPAEEVPAEETPMEEELPVFGDSDFDPRAFAGLDDEPEAFDPNAFAGVNTEEPEQSEEPEQPAEEPEKAPKEKKPKKKRKAGAVVALVLVILIVVAGAAAGLLWWLTTPVDETVLRDDFAATAQMEEGEMVLEFTVDRRETDRIGRSDAVWCSVATQTEAVYRERTYLMAYELTKEGWTLDAVEGTGLDAWLTEPRAGISLEQLQAALVGCELEPEEEFTYVLTEEDVSEVEILSQQTDLEAGTDVVEAEITVVNDLLAWTVTATVDCSFEESWNIDKLESSEAQKDYKPGLLFDLEQEQLLEALTKFPIVLGAQEDEEDDDMEVITTIVDGAEPEEEPAAEEQEVLVTESAVSEFTVTESDFSLAEDKHVVTCSFVLDKGVAQLYVQAEILCSHDGDEWVADEVRYEAEVEKVVLTGEWKGSYTESEGVKPNVTVKFAVKDDGTADNSFNFTASEASPAFLTGCYAVTPEVDTKTLAVDIKAGDWITNPGGNISVVGLKGTLMIEEAVITDNATFSIKLDRPEPVQTQEPAEQTQTAETTTQEDLNLEGTLGPNDLPIT